MEESMKIKRILPIFCLALVNYQNAQAISLNQPRLYGWGAVNAKAFGYADGMLSINSNPNGISFLDIIAKAGDENGRLLTAGAGHRQIVSSENILGGYLFFDNNRIPDGRSGWTIHPGAELIYPSWDFHLNGYIPIDSNKLVQQNHNVTLLSGHKEFLGKVNQFNQYAKGLDAIVGKRIPSFRNSRVYGSGYYYDYKSLKSIQGVEVGIQAPLNKFFSLLIRDSYDNYNHNEFSIGISLSLGDTPEMDKKTIQDHLLDPIQHYSGTLNTGTGTPVKIQNQFVSQMLVRDNIWFFKPGSSNPFSSANGFNNCTFEHPCSSESFSQSTINSIDMLAPNPNLYINTGSINFAGQYIDLANGTNIFGRMNNFAMPATGSARPLISGAFLLNGSNTLNNFRISGSNVTIPGIGTNAYALVSPVTATGAIRISQLEVSSSSTTLDAYAGYFRGGDIFIANSSFTAETSSPTDNIAGALSLGFDITSTTINNSIFSANNTGAEGRTEAIVIRGNNNVTINNTTISAFNANGTGEISDNSTIGIFLEDASVLTLNQSTVNTNQQGGIRDSSGLKALGTSTATINNSTFNIQANQAGNEASATNNIGAGNVTFNDSTIVVTTSGGATARLNQTGSTAPTLNNTTATCNGGACP